MRPGQPPQAVVVGHPVQRRRRDDHVDRTGQLKVQHVPAPHLRAAARPCMGERHHLPGEVDGQRPALAT
jgi:hypothetical protein